MWIWMQVDWLSNRFVVVCAIIPCWISLREKMKIFFDWNENTSMIVNGIVKMPTMSRCASIWSLDRHSQSEEHLSTISLVDLRVLRDLIHFFVFLTKQLNNDSRVFISVNPLMNATLLSSVLTVDQCGEMNFFVGRPTFVFPTIGMVWKIIDILIDPMLNCVDRKSQCRFFEDESMCSD